MKALKRIVDLLMVALLVGVIIVTPDVHTHGHVFMGTSLILVIAVHVCLNWKWIPRTSKAISNQGVSTVLRLKYLVILLMLVVWLVVAISSVFAGISYLMNVDRIEANAFLSMLSENGFLDVMEDYIHPFTGRLAGILAIIHLLQNLPQLRRLFSK